MKEIVTAAEPVRQAVILVGGRGTRLGSVTAATPKPLVDVAGRPFLDVLLLELGRHGFDRIVLLAGFAAEAIDAYAAATAMTARFGLDIAVHREANAAGTGGALVQARHLLDDRFLLLNGDSWLDTNLRALACREPPAGGAVMTVRALADAGRSGVVTLSGDRVARFLPRPEAPGPGQVNAGIYLVDRDALAGVPAVASLESDVLPRLAAEGRLAAHPAEGFFIDIGVPDALAAAQTEVPRQQRRGAVFFDRDGVLNVDHGHVGEIERFEWIEGAIEAVRLVNDAGYYAFVVTNQAGVAKGFYGEDSVVRLNRHIGDGLARAGAHIDAISWCPFHPDGVVPAFTRVSDRRKPAPGMILDLMAAWPVDPASSFLVGDKQTDLDAARAAGIAGHLYNGGRLDDLVRRLLGSRSRA